MLSVLKGWGGGWGAGSCGVHWLRYWKQANMHILFVEFYQNVLFHGVWLKEGSFKNINTGSTFPICSMIHGPLLGKSSHPPTTTTTSSHYAYLSRGSNTGDTVSSSLRFNPLVEWFPPFFYKFYP